MGRKSLSTKLFYTYAAIVLVILLSVSIGLSYLIRGYFYEVRRGELLRYATELAHNIDKFSDGNVARTELERKLSGVDVLLKARIWIVDKDYNVIYVSQGSDTRGVPKSTREQAFEETIRDKNMDTLRKPSERFVKIMEPIIDRGEVLNVEFLHPVYNEQVLMVGAPVYSGGNIIGAIMVSSAVSDMGNFLNAVYVYIANVIFVALALSLLLVHFFSKNTVAPLLAMQKSAAAMAQGDYQQRVKINGEDEVADLGKSLNLLGADLQEFVNKMNTQEKIRRDFVANVSHELRTPLTIIRGYNQAIADGTVQDTDKIKVYQGIISEEIERLERLINDLLDLSRIQAGKEVVGERIPLADLVGDVLQKLQIKAQDKKIRLEGALEPAEVFGNGDRLVQLVLILTDNAIKYTPSGGFVRVSLAQDGEFIRLIVEDTGKGIPQEDLPYIWERFYKVDKSHSRQDSGTGLGLAIAKEIMVLHKATVQVTSDDGSGTRIVISFPRV